MVRNERRKLRNESRCAAGVEIGLESLLDGGEPQLVERARLGGNEGPVDALQRPTAPKRICFDQQPGSFDRARRRSRLSE